MSVSARSLLVPGMAMATAGVLALAPSAVAPTPVSLAAPLADVPMVQIQDVQLAGIGRDIYNSITAFVQYSVSSAQYWIALVPIIGPPIADQVGINYFGLIQPVVANTVYVISDIISNPFNIVGYGATYFSQLGYIGYNWASDQAQFFGLPPFPPIPAPPPLASVKAPTRGAATPAAAATIDASDVQVSVDVAPASEVAAPVKAGAVRAARTAPSSDAPRAAATVAKATTADNATASDAGEAPSPSAGKAGASRGGAGGR